LRSVILSKQNYTMNDQWKKFWENYDAIESENEDGLYIQVGKQLMKYIFNRPIPAWFVGDLNGVKVLDGHIV